MIGNDMCDRCADSYRGMPTDRHDSQTSHSECDQSVFRLSLAIEVTNYCDNGFHGLPQIAA